MIATTVALRAVPDFKTDLIALIPHMRAFSRVLCGGKPISEDMTQSALLKAWRAQSSYQAGTNLKAWAFTILRNEYLSHMRRSWREGHWDSEAAERIPAPPSEQEWSMHVSDTVAAIQELPVGQREALILISVGGFSYIEAGKILGTAMGTVKSRVARARAALLKRLDEDRPSQPHLPPRVRNAPESVQAQLHALVPRGAGAVDLGA
jgi:RNA polymerase sigma factor (sigma-70 family)